jgi:predicted adenine nucleotide alpha hydrolase (AANH) superfamily ATPase
MRILVHICCAPCFTYPHTRLVDEGHEVTGFFFNPNIHPYSEYKKRLESLEKYAEIKGLKWIHGNDYDIETYLRGALTAEDRCGFCYEQRLIETARTANILGYDAFTTTLLISPYQKHELLEKTGKKAADEYGIEFFYEDFREGYNESRDTAKALDLYMQKYCGCVFSEKERYFKNKS